MKRIVICCDGTWNRPDSPNPTNVVRLSGLVAPVSSDGVPQITFYDQGVGTGNLLDKLIGGTFGKGLDQNIKDAYLFLAHNYSEGDEVYFFGYSRGAYTARSTVGLIRNCGLLRRGHFDQLDEAFALYQKRDESADTSEAIAFRSNHSLEIDIKFVGVWDTVGSLGMPLRGLRWFSRNKYQFHDTQLTSRVKNAYHAVAIDERRGPFVPTLWSGDSKPGQRIEQCWFTGVHSDVGGGVRIDGLSDITLRWMMDKSAESGLSFDEGMAAATISPDPFSYLHNSMIGMYKFTRGQTREIGVISPTTETVSGSAVERFERVESEYRPENLARYLDDAGKARTAADSSSSSDSDAA